MINLPYTPPLHQGLDILLLDDYLLVVNKPAGLLTVPGRGEDKQDCLYSRVLIEFPDARVVHRLDMATSGLLIFARGIDSLRLLSQLFCERKIEKQYCALVTGRLAQTTGEINLPLGADWVNRPRQKIDFEHGKAALTNFQLLEYDSHQDSSRVALNPVTGRTHQLRVHLASIGHPILGDGLYGGRGTQRLCLHATQLRFIHPYTEEALELLCPSPF